MKSRRTQAERSATAVATLVDAAGSLLSEQGFAKTSTTAIAARAGMTTGALHHHFPTKESLFIAVLDEQADRVIAEFADLGSKPEPGLSLARRLLSHLWAFYGDERYWAVWEVYIGFRSDPALREEVKSHRNRTVARIQDAIESNHYLDAHARAFLRKVLPFALSSLRGIFLETLVSQDARQVRSQLEMLARALDGMMISQGEVSGGTARLKIKNTKPRLRSATT